MIRFEVVDAVEAIGLTEERWIVLLAVIAVVGFTAGFVTMRVGR